MFLVLFNNFKLLRHITTQSAHENGYWKVAVELEMLKTIKTKWLSRNKSVNWCLIHYSHWVDAFR